jgi:hypothetical protein
MKIQLILGKIRQIFNITKLGGKKKPFPNGHCWMNVCVQHTICDESLEVYIRTHIHSMFSGALCFFQIQNEGLQ